MHSVAQALEIVLSQVKPLPPVMVTLGTDALGWVLAEDIASDLDMPPFDKAMMDGFAVRSSDLVDGQGELTIVEEILAGQTPKVEVKAGQASRIMTGAPIPRGVDAVVMIERCEMLEDGRVRVHETRVRPQLNILERAKEMRVGEVILKSGDRLRPQEFGLLSAVGRIAVKAHRPPNVAILSTGDEIVEPTQKPGPGQIRNSNGPMLLAQVARAGGVPKFLGIARDDPNHLRSMIAEGLQSEMLILSGGVSAGKLDLVPGILKELGVQALFHKVTMKPGKPVLFGVKPPHPQPLSPGGERGGNAVFGLPGNPVSSLVCFELFVRPAIRALMALAPGPRFVSASLTKDYPYRTDRPTYHPAHLEMNDSGRIVTPTAWFGSPDLRGVLPANAFVVLPAGDHSHRAGDRLRALCVEFED